VSYAWLEEMARKHGAAATGLHKVEAVDVSAEGEPVTVSTLAAHKKEDAGVIMR
jgi:hypothetical protein